MAVGARLDGDARLLVGSLLLLAALFSAWFHDAPARWIALAVFALPPLLLALARSGRFEPAARRSGVRSLAVTRAPRWAAGMDAFPVPAATSSTQVAHDSAHDDARRKQPNPSGRITPACPLCRRQGIFFGTLGIGALDSDGDLDLLCGEFLDRFTYFENIEGGLPNVHIGVVSTDTGAGRPDAAGASAVRRRVQPRVSPGHGSAQLPVDVVEDLEDLRVVLRPHKQERARRRRVHPRPGRHHDARLVEHAPRLGRDENPDVAAGAGCLGIAERRRRSPVCRGRRECMGIPVLGAAGVDTRGRE